MQVLTASGGSPHSEVALQFSTHLFREHRAGDILTILTVIKRDTDRAAAEQLMTRAGELVGSTVPEFRTKIRVGHPAEEIIREAEEGTYDLVIVGEKQHHGLVTRFLLGSTAERVVEHAPCPVTIAKGKIGPIRRILLCDSGLPDPSLLHRFRAQLPDLLNNRQEVTILHVMSQISAGPGVPGEQLRAEADQLMAKHAPEGELLMQDIQTLEQLSVHAHPKVRHGFVVDEIVAEAQCEKDYDLVVIGAHRGEGWRRILLDDLTRQIIAQVDRPTLVVR